MFKDFNSLIKQVENLPPARLSVAQADDRDIILTIKEGVDRKIIQPYLFGNQKLIEKYMNQVGLSKEDVEIINTEGRDASKKAVKLVSSGEADILMKGMVATSSFLKEVVNREYGLRQGRLLSHIAALELANLERIIFVTDGGMNIEPSLEEKIDIVRNGIDTLEALGYEDIYIAILSASENVNKNIQSSIDGAIISKMGDRQQIKGATIDGPLALDNILSRKAALEKGIKSPVAGKANLILVPNIETGNALGKSVTFMSKGNMSGIIAGAQAPIVLSSRADTRFSKLSSIVLASLVYRGKRKEAGKIHR